MESGKEMKLTEKIKHSNLMVAILDTFTVTALVLMSPGYFQSKNYCNFYESLTCGLYFVFVTSLLCFISFYLGLKYGRSHFFRIIFFKLVLIVSIIWLPYVYLVMRDLLVAKDDLHAAGF